jgi:hypothetical protein
MAERSWAVISVPNVAHLSVRLALLNGNFTYRDTGLLDRTHLRFFDRPGVDRLLSESDWQLIELARVTRRLGSTEIPVDNLDWDLARSLESDVEATTYQFVMVAAPAGSAASEQPPLLPAAVAQSICLQQASEIERLQRASIPDLHTHLSEIRQAALDRRRQLQDLLKAIEEDSERLRQTIERLSRAGTS